MGSLFGALLVRMQPSGGIASCTLAIVHALHLGGTRPPEFAVSVTMSTEQTSHARMLDSRFIHVRPSMSCLLPERTAVSTWSVHLIMPDILVVYASEQAWCYLIRLEGAGVKRAQQH